MDNPEKLTALSTLETQVKDKQHYKNTTQKAKKINNTNPRKIL
jgi:hypothetical protein